MKIALEKQKFQEALEISTLIEEKQRKIFRGENLHGKNRLILVNIEINSRAEVKEEAKIRECILKLEENYQQISESLDDELKNMSCLMISFYKKLKYAYKSLNDKENAQKNHELAIGEIQKLGLQSSYILIKHEFMYFMKKLVDEDPNLSPLEEINKLTVLLKDYEN